MTTSCSCGDPKRRGAVSILVAALAFLAGAVWPAGAQDNLSETLQRSEKDQQQIQSQAQEFAAQLRAMSSEFERNGLTGDSVKMLDALSSALGTMSEQEMTRIIGLLRQARTLNDKTAVLQQVAAAYTGQKKLTVDMKALLARYQKDQLTADVAATLAKLADRQAVNFQAGVDVAQWTETKRANNKSDENPQDALKAAVEVQSAEQAALRDEARLAMDRLQNAARDKSDPAAAARAQAALDKLKPINAMLDQAAQDLKDNHLFKAVGAEKAARDGLRQLARELTPIKQSDADSLRQAAREVDDMITQQKEMIAQTEKANQKPPDFEKWLQQGMNEPKSEAHRKLDHEKLLGKTLDELKAEPKAKEHYDGTVREATAKANQQMGQLETRANELVNKSDDVGQNLQPNANDAAATVKAAQEKLRAARADLDDHDAAPALQNQQAALAQLQQAQKQIQARIAAEEAGANRDRTASLQAIKQQGKELANQQNAASQQQALQPQAASNSPQQADLKKKAQDLQAKAAQSQSPTAATAFQNAANQMEKAADALNKPNGQPQAQASEAAAQAELAKADAALDKDIAQSTAAKQQLQQAEAALAVLEKVIAGEEKVQSDATGLATKKPAAKAGELASRQVALKGQTAAILPMLDTPELKPAAAPLNDAQLQMATAHGAFTRSDVTGALEPVRVAMTDLLQAKAILAAKRDALQQQTSPQTAEQQAQQAKQDTAQQIAQAQQEAQQAQQQLAQQAQQNQSSQAQQQAQQSQEGQSPQAQQQSPQGQSAQANQQQQSGQPPGAQPPPAPQALNDAANLAGQAAASSNSPEMKQNLQDAQKALNNAAAAATKGDNAGAQAQTQKAQDALAQAQAQAAQAQAGLAQAPPGQSGSQPSPGSPSAPGGKPSSAPGTPGQQPGQKPGPSKGESPQGTGDRDASNIGDGKIVQGSNAPGKQGSTFSRLPARDRAALQQSQSEKYPQEYGQMIEQYMQNLADQPGS